MCVDLSQGGTIGYLLFDRNENEAVRDGSSVGCAVV